MLSGRPAPVAFWGFGPDWTADPPQCGALADPVADAATTRVVGFGRRRDRLRRGRRLAAAQVPFDPALIAECGSGPVGRAHQRHRHLVPAPAIDGAATVGMATAATTVVEGGTETHSRADTFTAYLGDYVAFVTVVTDPGSPNPPLGQEFAAALLVKTVSALRG